jgi:hypothetical protein
MVSGGRELAKQELLSFFQAGGFKRLSGKLPSSRAGLASVLLRQNIVTGTRSADILLKIWAELRKSNPKDVPALPKKPAGATQGT